MVLFVWQTGAATQAPSLEPKVDALFARWTATTPGCAVGVGSGGRSVLERAYGMADLEHDVRNKPDTIFEAGSVSKQFTAAAVLLLVRDGKIALEDPVRKYIPELPDYRTPLTIRHMLNHTSGLRDWGSLAGIAGWPRGSRVHTHAHVVEILSRQTALNFTPGSRYSYSNSGYNLAAVLVARVSGMSFAEFSQKRLFQPLGMTRTSWRDDYTLVLKDRAIAYAGAAGGFRLDMPFENVHGNGGLLTTVGDLLRWNENFVTPKVGDADFVKLQQTTVPFTSGTMQTYAFGLMIGTYKGVREVSHSGSTAGYRAHLMRYPDQHVSVAVLCNAGTANATQLARSVADLYLGDRLNPSAPPVPPPAETRGPLTGHRPRRHVQAHRRRSRRLRRHLSQRGDRDDARRRGPERRPGGEAPPRHDDRLAPALEGSLRGRGGPGPRDIPPRKGWRQCSQRDARSGLGASVQEAVGSQGSRGSVHRSANQNPEQNPVNPEPMNAEPEP